MKIFRWLAVSFSMYSKIPMPRFTWREDDMSHSLFFFPFVGALIGALIVILNGITPLSEIYPAVRIILTIAIPLIVTGGFHTDGFMDTEDALHSYAPADEKLSILKDPHVGAFSVISLIKWMLIQAAAVTGLLLSSKTDLRILLLFGLTFVMSRALSALTSLLFVKARKDGMLSEETKRAGKASVITQIVILTASAAGMLCLQVLCGSAVILSFMLVTVYYRYKTYREFGGVTGDTAGYFVTVAEIVSAAALSLAVNLIA